MSDEQRPGERPEDDERMTADPVPVSPAGPGTTDGRSVASPAEPTPAPAESADPASADPASVDPDPDPASVDPDLDPASVDPAPEAAASPAPAAARPRKPPRAARPRPARRDARRMLALGGRLGVALLAAAGAVALAAGVILMPGPSIQAAAPAIDVVPDRGDQLLVCPGPVLGLSAGAEAQVAAVANPERLASGTGLVEGGIPISDALEGGAATVTLPVGAPDTRVAAVERTEPATDDVRGLAAGECAAPQPTSWLVGGDTTTGRTTWIVLSNPGAVAATVALDVYGTAGLVDAPGTRGIVVAPGSQRVIPLAGLAPGELSPVVGVTSRGGSVTATLQQTIVRGLDPAGATIVTGSPAPALRQVIPAFPVIDLAAVAEVAADDGSLDYAPTLRLLVPGEDDAEVAVRIIPAGGGAEVLVRAEVEAGRVLDVSLSERVTDGEYALAIESDVPVVAGARIGALASAGLDVAWVSAAPVLDVDDGEVIAAVAPGSGALLHLVAGGSAVTVAVDGRELEIPAQGAVTLPVAGSSAPRITTTGEVHAAVSYRGDAGLDVSRVLPPAGSPRPLTIYP